MIDEKPVSFSKAALVSGAVSINTCPAAWQCTASILKSSLDHRKKNGTKENCVQQDKKNENNTATSTESRKGGHF